MRKNVWKLGDYYAVPLFPRYALFPPRRVESPQDVDVLFAEGAAGDHVHVFAYSSPLRRDAAIQLHVARASDRDDDGYSKNIVYSVFDASLDVVMAAVVAEGLRLKLAGKYASVDLRIQRDGTAHAAINVDAAGEAGIVKEEIKIETRLQRREHPELVVLESRWFVLFVDPDVLSDDVKKFIEKLP